MRFKKVYLFIILVIMVFSLSGCFKERENDALKFKEEYEKFNGEKSSSGKVYPEVLVDENNIIEYISMNRAEEIVDDGTGVIYFGYASCPWCRNAISVLLKAAENTDIDKIYYVDMEDARDIKKIGDNGEIITTKEASDGYYDLVDELDDILLDYTIKDKNGNEVNTGDKRIYVPLVVFVVDGEIVNYHLDTVSSQTDPYIPLNEEEQIELFNIYSDGIHDVLGDICDEEARC